MASAKVIEAIIDIVQNPPMTMEDVGVDKGEELLRLLQLTDVAKEVVRCGKKNIVWVMPGANGIKWQTIDGKVHYLDI